MEVLPEVVQDVWEWWCRERTPEERRAELEALAQAPEAEVRQAILAAVADIGADQPKEVRLALTRLLAQVPAAIRQSLRRPADPEGLSLSLALAPREADDLMALLPLTSARFQPGDRPLPGIDWELVELLGRGGFGEVWKARNPHFDGVPPVALKFCLDFAARDGLLRHEAAILNQVMRQGNHPGIVKLQHTYLSADPPCLEYEYVPGGNLGGLIRDWHQHGRRISLAEQASRMLLDLARIIAFAHRLNPPIVHRDLKPANILTQQDAAGKTILRVADFGIGGVAAHEAIARTRGGVSQGLFLVTALRGAHTPLYASPQQVRGAAPDPRDDVFSLGVIWYQMLTGQLTANRPGGTRWARRLEENGLPPKMVELLGCCVEEDPSDRPADAGDLADRLGALLGESRTARAAVDLADQLQRNLGQVSRDHEEARRLAEQQHDYAAAAGLLAALPDHLRDDKMYTRVCQWRDRVSVLDRAIREAVALTRMEGLRPKVEELLQLQPERADLHRLLQALPGLRDLAKQLTNSIGMQFSKS